MFLHLTIGFWLGIYAVRTYVPAAVWNVSDALPLYLKGGIAIGVHLIGVVGGVILSRRRVAARPIVIALAIVTILRQFVLTLDMTGAVVSMISWILWLWWLAVVPARAGRINAAAFASAFVLQAITQWIWHGLDLPMAIGPVSSIVAIALGVALILSHRASDEPATWFNAGVGPAFFLEVTLLANAGRIAILGTEGAAAFAIAQVAIVAMLFAATGKAIAHSALAYFLSWIMSFSLLFAFYNRYEWPELWIVAAVIVVATAAPGFTRLRFEKRTAVAAVALAAIVLLPRTSSTASHVNASAHSLRVANYNIHQGFDAYGAPGMSRIADEIASFDADVVALEEVNRGWTFVGGADLVEYLRYRFPDYAIEFVPVNGSMWGIVLMSRFPLLNPGGGRFDTPKGTFGYGYAAADITLGGDTIHLVGVHLTAGLEGNGDNSRADQARELVRRVGNYENTIMLGDFNNERQNESIKAIMSAGYRDALGEVGLAEKGTWPAHEPKEHIDYVFLRGRLKAKNGRIPATLASDHLPVVFDVELDPRRPTSGDHAVNPQ